MEIRCIRTGERRYRVVIHRENKAPIDVGGPGYDPLMPHDLCHFIAERELGIRHGIFGFLGDLEAAGKLENGGTEREARRGQRKAHRAADKMLKQGGRDEGPRSERAQWFLLYAWLRRSSDAKRRQRAANMLAHSPNLLDEGRAISEESIVRSCAAMDDLSARWQALEVDEYFTLAWPEVFSRPRRKSKRSR